MDWEGALLVFDKVSSLLSDVELGLLAREESAWCKCQSGAIDQGLQELEQVLSVMEDIEGDEILSARARCLWRIGKTNMDLGSKLSVSTSLRVNLSNNG